MGKQARREELDFEMDDQDVGVMMNDADYDLDDEAFFDQFQSKQSRRNKRGTRNARRRIEQLREERELARQLDEYYMHLDDD